MNTCAAAVKAIARRQKLSQGALLNHRDLVGLVPRSLSCALAEVLDPAPTPIP